jgi:hypothetical protein
MGFDGTKWYGRGYHTDTAGLLAAAILQLPSGERRLRAFLRQLRQVLGECPGTAYALEVEANAAEDFAAAAAARRAAAEERAAASAKAQQGPKGTPLWLPPSQNQGWLPPREGSKNLV